MKLKFVIIVFSVLSLKLDAQNFFERDWKVIIDSTWDSTYSKVEMLDIYDSVWTIIHNNYACFQNLNSNWDSLTYSNRDEIQNGISTGRFVGMLNHLGMALQESHTYISEGIINQNLHPTHWTPLIYRSDWGTSHFGAGLSPLPDSSLLVYSVVPNHPLGLEVGDIVLGYESVPWKKLYKLLLKMEFPTGSVSAIGSNDISFTENMLKSLGNNWHLFETIDFVKYSTNDTVHLPTSLLEGQSFDLFTAGQLPVNGVEYFTNTKLNPLSWGIVENTNIGYIYSWNWFPSETSELFYNALDSLINTIMVDGIIIDIRANNGGYFRYTDRGLNLLFKNSPPSFGLASRDNNDDLYLLRNSIVFNLYTDTTEYFEKPIAVLTGSNTVSAADFLALRLKELSNVKIFGSNPTGSYSSSEHINIGSIIISYAYLNSFIETEPTNYLTHSTLPIDFKVHFLPDDVVKGIDTVVKEAIIWINNNIPVSIKNDNKQIEFFLSQNYPNPFNPTTVIQFSIPISAKVTLKLFDVLGREMQTLVNEIKSPGNYKVEFDGSELPSGVYFYKLHVAEYVETKKMILLK